MNQPCMTPVEMLEKLVAFDTVSSKSNLALIDFVTGYLAEFGVEGELVPNKEGTKANLWATVGPRVRGGVCLSGHTDVVPVEGQDWSGDPFQLRAEGGRLYGRGTCDMKGFVATALALLPEMSAAPLKRPIHFALSYDEEVNCLGAPDMINQIGGRFPQPSVVIVGEPSSMQVVSAHKGCWGLHVTVTGKEAHSSLMHQGVSAVMVAARLVAKLDDMTRTRAAAADPDCGFDPPYTTLHVGMINGGTAGNIIARQCEFPVDIRYLPEDFPEDILEEFTDWYGQEILPAMQAIDPASGIALEIINRTPGLRADMDSEAEQFARMLTGDNDRRQVSYCTEAGYFQDAGIATIICGPGDIAQAHKPDEFVAMEQMASCESFLRKLIDRCRV